MKLFISILIFWLPSAVFAEPLWNLPVEVTDSNTEVRFEVDSTWHLVKGKTSGLSGRIWLDNPKDFSSVKAEIDLPVSNFDTDSKSRDKSMREVMHADENPTVKFMLSNIASLCSPEKLVASDACAATADGTLTINNVSKIVQIPIEVSRSEAGFKVEGNTSLQWADYGVEDPSILIARLDPTVTISFKVELEPSTVNIKEAARAQHP